MVRISLNPPAVSLEVGSLVIKGNSNSCTQVISKWRRRDRYPGFIEVRSTVHRPAEGIDRIVSIDLDDILTGGRSQIGTTGGKGTGTTDTHRFSRINRCRTCRAISIKLKSDHSPTRAIINRQVGFVGRKIGSLKPEPAMPWDSAIDLKVSFFHLIRCSRQSEREIQVYLLVDVQSLSNGGAGDLDIIIRISGQYNPALSSGLETVDILRHHFHPVLSGTKVVRKIEIIVFANTSGISFPVREGVMKLTVKEKIHLVYPAIVQSTCQIIRTQGKSFHPYAVLRAGFKPFPIGHSHKINLRHRQSVSGSKGGHLHDQSCPLT